MFGSSCHPLILRPQASLFWCLKNRVGHYLTQQQSYVGARKTRIQAIFELVGRAHKRVFGLRVVQYS